MQINNFSKLIFIYTSLLAVLFCMFATSCRSTKLKDREWLDDYVIDEQYGDFISEAETYLKNKHFSGTILVSKGQDIIYAKGFGLNDNKDFYSLQNTIHTTYEVGQITKQFTSAAILQLIESGDIKLNDTIDKFFPDYKYGKDISIEMLLSMHSGLFDHINMPYEFFPYEVAKEIDKATAECRNDDVDRYIVLDYLNEAPLYAEPNTTYFYCNTDYYILGIIIEKVTGMKYEDYIQKYIFDKIGMYNSNMNYQQTTAKGYDYKGRYYSIPKGIALGCVDLNSCVLDLFKWNYSLAHGEIISPENFQEMINNNYGVYHDPFSFLQNGITDVFNSFSQYYIDHEISLIVLCNEPISDNSARTIANTLSRMFMEYDSAQKK